MMRTISTYILFSGRFAICCCLLWGNMLLAGSTLPGFMFTENKGQLADPDGNVLNEVLFYGKGGKLSVYFTANKLVFLEREDYKVESEESKKARAEGHNTLADELETRIIPLHDAGQIAAVVARNAAVEGDGTAVAERLAAFAGKLAACDADTILRAEIAL